MAFSALLTLDGNANLINFDFRKTVIRSRVKGVYSEINAIMEGSAAQEIEEKYQSVDEKLVLMKELAQKLIANRKLRGAPEIETEESKIIVDESDVAVDIKPRVRGFSERMIEEFMLTANEAAAIFAKQANIPFVYRVHENPPDDKLETLSEALHVLGVNAKGVQHGIRPKKE